MVLVPQRIVVPLVFYTASAAPSAFGSSPRQGSQDSGVNLLRGAQNLEAPQYPLYNLL